MKFKIVLEPSDEGGFKTHVPALPGYISERNSEEEAMRNIKEVIELYLKSTQDEVADSKRAIVKELVL